MGVYITDLKIADSYSYGDKTRQVPWDLYVSDSIHDTLLRSDELKGKFGNASTSARDSYGGEDWHGTASYEEAFQLCEDGWSEARRGVDTILTPLRDRLADKLANVTERHHDLVGYEPDIDRFVSGEMECMWDDRVVPQPTKGKVVTLLVQATFTGANDPEAIKAQGAAIIALVEAMELCGFELDIWVENSTRQDNDEHSPQVSYHTVLTHAHRAGELFDINGFMFALGHPSWLRRIIFGIMEGFPGLEPSGYGQVVSSLAFDRVNPSMELKLGDAWSKDAKRDPFQWVLDQLIAQGVYDGE